MYEIKFDEYGNIDYESSDSRAIEWFESMYISLPRYDNGDVVQAGDLVMDTDGEVMRVHHIEFSSKSNEWTLFDKHNRFMTMPLFIRFEETDSLERIKADAVKSMSDYWKCWDTGACTDKNCAYRPEEFDGKTPIEHYGVTYCIDAQRLDIVERMRKLYENED
jgi:hypothetical protein